MLLYVTLLASSDMSFLYETKATEEGLETQGATLMGSRGFPSFQARESTAKQAARHEADARAPVRDASPGGTRARSASTSLGGRHRAAHGAGVWGTEARRGQGDPSPIKAAARHETRYFVVC